MSRSFHRSLPVFQVRTSPGFPARLEQPAVRATAWLGPVVLCFAPPPVAGPGVAAGHCPSPVVGATAVTPVGDIVAAVTAAVGSKPVLPVQWIAPGPGPGLEPGSVVVALAAVVVDNLGNPVARP